MKKLLYLILLAGISLTACNSEETLTPSTVEEPGANGYMLPQGNHSFDATIVSYFERYGCVMLYEFTENDAYNDVVVSYKTPFMRNLKVYYDEANTTLYPGWYVAPADPQYIAAQLDLINDRFLRFFPDEFLKKTLPRMILLASVLREQTNQRTLAPPFEPSKMTTSRDMMFKRYHAVINYGSAEVTTITAAKKNNFTRDMCVALLQRAIDLGVYAIPEEFLSVSDYSASITNSNRYSLGFLTTMGNNPATDWADYLKIITYYPKAIIDGTGHPAGGSILNPTYDTNGLIRKKYDAIIALFNQMGIDIQAIGDAKL